MDQLSHAHHILLCVNNDVYLGRLTRCWCYGHLGGCCYNISDPLLTRSSKQHGCSYNSKTTYLKHYSLKTVHYLLSGATFFFFHHQPSSLLFSCMLSFSADWQLTISSSGWKHIQMCICPIQIGCKHDYYCTKLLCN